MVVRAAVPADALPIARVHVETWRAAYAGILPDEFLAGLSVGASAGRWEGRLLDPGAGTYVHGDPVVGFVSVGAARDGDVGEVGEVYAIYVLPGAQGAGVGRALLDAGIGWLGSHGFGEGVLWVLSENVSGRAFYEACGWGLDGAERSVDLGGTVAPEVRYRNRWAVRALT